VENTIKEKQTDFNGVKGLNGLLYTSKINGNSIFFPSTGNYDGTSHEGKNLVTLWTANMPIIEYNSHYATYFFGNSSTPFSSNARFCGYPVRPVVILKN
jgi:putative NADPH-quinone reductase